MEDGTNLVEETLKRFDGREVDWVGSADGEYAMSWDEFVEKFKGLNYDSGYGAQHIATDLVVVFTDGSWLERHEYDGSEWWEIKRRPARFENAKSFKCVGGNGYSWDPLHEMNDSGEEECDD